MAVTSYRYRSGQVADLDTVRSTFEDPHLFTDDQRRAANRNREPDPGAVDPAFTLAGQSRSVRDAFYGQYEDRDVAAQRWAEEAARNLIGGSDVTGLRHQTNFRQNLFSDTYGSRGGRHWAEENLRNISRSTLTWLRRNPIQATGTGSDAPTNPSTATARGGGGGGGGGGNSYGGGLNTSLGPIGGDVDNWDYLYHQDPRMGWQRWHEQNPVDEPYSQWARGNSSYNALYGEYQGELEDHVKGGPLDDFSFYDFLNQRGPMDWSQYHPGGDLRRPGKSIAPLTRFRLV